MRWRFSIIEMTPSSPISEWMIQWIWISDEFRRASCTIQFAQWFHMKMRGIFFLWNCHRLLFETWNHFVISSRRIRCYSSALAHAQMHNSRNNKGKISQNISKSNEMPSISFSWNIVHDLCPEMFLGWHSHAYAALACDRIWSHRNFECCENGIHGHPSGEREFGRSYLCACVCVWPRESVAKHTKRKKRMVCRQLFSWYSLSFQQYTCSNHVNWHMTQSKWQIRVCTLFNVHTLVEQSVLLFVKFDCIIRFASTTLRVFFCAPLSFGRLKFEVSFARVHHECQKDHFPSSTIDFYVFDVWRRANKVSRSKPWDRETISLQNSIVGSE